MVKRWRSYLSLLVSFAFILSMLFLDICEVKAAYNYSDTFTSVYRPNGGYCSITSTTSGNINNGSGSIRSYPSGYVRQYGSYHVRVPIVISVTWSDLGAGNYTYASDFPQGQATYLTYYAYNLSFSATGGNVSNLSLYDENDKLIATSSNNSGSTVGITRPVGTLTNAYGTHALISFFVEYDVSDTIRINHTSAIGSGDDFSFSTNCSFSCTVAGRIAYDDEINNAKIEVHDSGANQSLDNIEQSEAAISDSVTNPSGGGILGTIKNFFNGFFGWLHDTILGLFVPSSDYFTTWFSNVNNLLSAKLGMLYAPLDLLISTLNAVYSASSDFTGVPFPEIRWGDTVLVSAQNLTFSNLLGEHFADIQSYVYFGTDVVLLFAFLMLLQRKITLVLRGHESG